MARALGLSVRTARLGDVALRLDPHRAQVRVLPQVLQQPRSRAERQYVRTPQGHQDRAVVSFGGPLAEAKFRKLSAEDMAPWWAGPWRLDLENLLRDADTGPLGPLRDRAGALVDDLWPIIERVAAELLQHGALSGADLDGLL